jgi:glycosyltransferase involved in cell wall biosynthesis
MRLCMLSDFNYPHVKGGGERRMHEIARRLVQLGVDVTLLCMRLPDIEDAEEIDGVKIVHLGPRILNPPKRSIINLIHYTASSLIWLLRHRFDVIEANTYIPLLPAFLAGKLKGTPVFATVHDVYLTEWSSQYSPKTAGMVERVLVKLPFDEVITVSNATRERIAGEMGVAEEKIRVIPNGVDLEFIDSVKARQHKHKTVLYAGRLIEHKHVDDLIKAMKKVVGGVPDARLSIAGGGVEEQELTALVRELGMGDKTTFLGVLGDRELAAEMKKSRLIALPSTREGFGIVLAEANACSRPVVAYRSGGVVDVVQDGFNGFLVEPRNVDALAERIMVLLLDDKLAAGMGANGRKRVEELYTWNNTAAEFMRVLKQHF